MKTIQSEPINITENIFGKITFSPKKKKIRSQYIYIASKMVFSLAFLAMPESYPIKTENNYKSVTAS